MAGFRLVVSDDLGQVLDGIEGAIGAVRDFRPLWQSLKREWYTSRRRMFHTQGRSNGTPWPQYKDTAERWAYRWIKPRLLTNPRFANVPLRWQPGREVLYPSLVSSRHPLSVWEPTRRTLTTGTDVPYAWRHDRGAGRAPLWAGGYAIPRRPLLAMGQRFRNVTKRQVQELAADVARQLGKGARVGLQQADARRRLGR